MPESVTLPTLAELDAWAAARPTAVWPTKHADTCPVAAYLAERHGHSLRPAVFPEYVSYWGGPSLQHRTTEDTGPPLRALIRGVDRFKGNITASELRRVIARVQARTAEKGAA